MCATVSWGAHESFMHPIFVLKNGCDNIMFVSLAQHLMKHMTLTPTTKLMKSLSGHIVPSL
jgi:hypothetical protein